MDEIVKIIDQYANDIEDEKLFSRSKGIALRLYNAGYRLDPYPNGKSKGELLAIIEAKEAELARARNLLYKAVSPHIAVQLDSDLLADVNVFLAETSTVKS